MQIAAGETFYFSSFFELDGKEKSGLVYRPGFPQELAFYKGLLSHT